MIERRENEFRECPTQVKALCELLTLVGSFPVVQGNGCGSLKWTVSLALHWTAGAFTWSVHLSANVV